MEISMLQKRWPLASSFPHILDRRRSAFHRSSVLSEPFQAIISEASCSLDNYRLRAHYLSDIPFDVPVVHHSIQTHKNLQNPIGATQARCLGDNRDVYEQLVLRHLDSDKVAIQSARNDRYLQVRTNSDCVFASKRVSEQDFFSIATDSTCSLFFVSCFMGNVLPCNDDLVVQCENKNRLETGAWHIVEPHSSSSSPVHQAQSVPGQRYALAGRVRQYLILDLAKGGKTPDEIEQIVTRLFDSPASSTYTIPLDKK